METKDIHWIAGWLEGEGSFSLGKNGRYPRISGNSIDYDTMVEVARILDANLGIRKDGRISYQFHLHGPKAIGWMLTLYTLMKSRRRRQIRICIEVWKIPWKMRSINKALNKGI